MNKHLAKAMAFVAGLGTGLGSTATPGQDYLGGQLSSTVMQSQDYLGGYIIDEKPIAEEIVQDDHVLSENSTLNENTLAIDDLTIDEIVATMSKVVSLVMRNHPFMDVWDYVQLAAQCPIPPFTYTEALGSYQNGHLRDALMLENSPCVVAHKGNRYGTWGLIHNLTMAARDVSRAYEVPVEVYDLSRKQGGKIIPHVSHQNGLDADVAPLFFDRHEQKYRTGRFGWKQFDNSNTWEANWQMLKFLHRGVLNAVFWDQHYIGKLKAHVLEQHGMDEWEQYGSILKHEDNHAGHFHVRMEKPVYVAMSSDGKHRG